VYRYRVTPSWLRFSLTGDKPLFLLQKYLEPSPWLQTNFPFKAFQHKLATDAAGPEGE